MKNLKRQQAAPAGADASEARGRDTDALLFDGLSRSMASASSRRGVIKAAFAGMVGVVGVKLGIRPVFAASNCLCNGHVYDSDTACCTAAGIVPKHPIADLDSCPNRVANRSHVCMPNGCGGKGGWRPPQRFFSADFAPSCNEHDCCYDVCRSVKSTCDSNFLNALTRSCQNAYPATDVLSAFRLEYCLEAALTYYGFVVAAGAKYYNAAQRESCDCCSDSTCMTCAGGACGSLPACAGGGDCVCFTSPEGLGVCIHGNTPCAGAATCSSNADCPPGYGCAATTCCGGPPVCGPLCSDVVPGVTAPKPHALAGRGKTLGGF